MTMDAIGPATVAVTAVLALLVIRTAVAELRNPGTARRPWAFLRDTRALTTGPVPGEPGTPSMRRWPGNLSPPC